MLSFFPLVSGEITSKGALSGFSKGHESENLEVGGPVSMTATARGGAAGQGTRTEEKSDPEICVARSLVTQWALQFIVANDLTHLRSQAGLREGLLAQDYTTK